MTDFESSRMNEDILRIQIWQRPMWVFIPHLVSVATSCDPPAGAWVPDVVERTAPGAARVHCARGRSVILAHGVLNSMYLHLGGSRS